MRRCNRGAGRAGGEGGPARPTHPGPHALSSSHPAGMSPTGGSPTVQSTSWTRQRPGWCCAPPCPLPPLPPPPPPPWLPPPRPWMQQHQAARQAQVPAARSRHAVRAAAAAAVVAAQAAPPAAAARHRAHSSLQRQCSSSHQKQGARRGWPLPGSGARGWPGRAGRGLRRRAGRSCWSGSGLGHRSLCWAGPKVGHLCFIVLPFGREAGTGSGFGMDGVGALGAVRGQTTGAVGVAGARGKDIGSRVQGGKVG